MKFFPFRILCHNCQLTFAAASDKTRHQQQQQPRSQQQQQQQQQKSLTLPLAGRNKTQTQTQETAGDTEMRFKCMFSPKGNCDESEDASNSEHNRVGQSVFYDCIDASPACIEEKQDAMKPEKGDTTDEEGKSNKQTKSHRDFLLHQLQTNSFRNRSGLHHIRWSHLLGCGQHKCTQIRNGCLSHHERTEQWFQICGPQDYRQHTQLLRWLGCVSVLVNES